MHRACSYSSSYSSVQFLVINIMQFHIINTMSMEKEREKEKSHRFSSLIGSVLCYNECKIKKVLLMQLKTQLCTFGLIKNINPLNIISSLCVQEKQLIETRLPSELQL